MKSQFIHALSPGDRVDTLFLLEEKTVHQKKNGEDFLSLAFSDKTGQLKGVAWDQVPQLKSAETGTFFQVKGTVSEYRGNLQLTVTAMTPVEKEAADPGDFLPVTPRNPDSMFDRLKKTVDETVKSPSVKALLEAFFSDADFVRRFMTAPAAKKMHHAYLGGLLEHTLSMTVLAKEIAKHYSGVNLDLLLAGAVLHDIGKIREFEYEYAIAYSDEGKLLTHIVIGCGMVDEKIREIENFPKKTAMLIKHLIVSHHGIREFGSPEPPRLLEAVLLNYIDEIDAKMNGLRNFIADEDPASAWSSYNYMLGRHLYLGGLEDDSQPDNGTSTGTE